jgi:hypothetical protein
MLAIVLLTVAGLVGACGSSAATPTATAETSATASSVITVFVTPTPTATVTPSPTKTKSGGSGGTPEPAPKPNLMGLVPVLSPTNPVCDVNFKIDFQVGNKGLGDATRATTVRVVDRTATGGADLYRGIMNIPALPASTGGHYYLTVRVPSYGDHVLTLTIDPDHLVAESNEADNVVTKSYSLLRGDCKKP